MNKILSISTSPHLRQKITTNNIMMWVFIALMPATIFSFYQFGTHAVLIVGVTTVSAVLFEFLYCKLLGKEQTIQDMSAAITGLLLALNLPPEATWWMCLLGSGFAIIVVKQLFGGLGQNIMNPALAARCFLLISFTGRMTNFAYDGFSGATPLAELKESGAMTVSILDQFIGTTPGTLGETSVIAILIGAAILLFFKIIDFRIPGMIILSFSICILLFGGRGVDLTYLLHQILGGGFMLGVWFMATDYVTSPITKRGQLYYGICIGVLAAIFRVFGNSAEGMSYAIIFSNLLVPLIEKISIPKAFGRGGE